MTNLVDEAAQAGVDNFVATVGSFPDRFKMLLTHAPGAFAGYGLMRATLMQDPPTGALDLKTKELTFTVLSTLYGDKYGAIVHAIAGMKLGLTLPQIAEVVRQSGALLSVDAVTTAGMQPFDMAGWGIDYVYTGAQKCLSAPPGVAPVAISARRRSMRSVMGTGLRWQAGESRRPYRHGPRQSSAPPLFGRTARL